MLIPAHAEEALSKRSASKCRLEALPQLPHRRGGVDHSVREAPFIVVPAQDTHQLALDHRGFQAVDGRAGRGAVIIDRNQRLVAIIEDACERTALGSRLEPASLHELRADLPQYRQSVPMNVSGTQKEIRAMLHCLTAALVTLMVLLPVHEVSAYLGQFVLR